MDDRSDTKPPLFTANGSDPAAERSEPFKRIGCTVLTALVVLILVISVIYFITGLASMGVTFWQTMR
jgi:hypothetical protein